MALDTTNLSAFMLGVTNAIRTKKGTTDVIQHSLIDEEIMSIQSGGGLPSGIKAFAYVSYQPTTTTRNATITHDLGYVPDLILMVARETQANALAFSLNTGAIMVVGYSSTKGGNVAATSYRNSLSNVTETSFDYTALNSYYSLSSGTPYDIIMIKEDGVEVREVAE